MFFRRFCNKDPSFCGFTPEIVKVRAFFKMKTFFSVFTPKVVVNTFVFGPHSQIKNIELFVPPQNLFKPTQSRYPGARPDTT